MRKFFLVASALLASLTPLQAAWADASLEGSHPAQWRLVWNSDPATSATLCWSTKVAGHAHRVLLRRDGSPEQQTPEQQIINAQRNGRYSAKEPDLFFHHVALSDLQPATKYHVVLESDDQKSPEFFFLTAPAEETPLALLFGADSRSGQEARRKMNAMLARMLRESYQPGHMPILALAHGGDFIYDGRRLNQWSRWMTDHELTVTDEGQLLPIIPARGNHDGGKMFNEVFAFPPEDKNYYGVDLGPEIRLLTLNTETSLAGDQSEWLARELAQSRPKRRWLLAQYHRPAFPAVKIPWLNLIHWVPLFEEHNLDVACEGDGHNIKRTPPIRDSKIDPTGVVYIGEGGLGVGQRTPKTNRWYLNSSQAKTGQGHHVQLLEFSDENLTYRVVLLGGEVFDEHTIPVRKPAQIEPQHGEPQHGEPQPAELQPGEPQRVSTAVGP